MVPKIEKIINESFHLGEGPHWDTDTQTLYFVDIFDQFIHKYVPSTQKHTKAHVGASVSVIIPVEGKDDEFVISMDGDLVLISWDGESDKISIIKKLAKVGEKPENKLNDGKCDPSGRLWIGTIGAEEEDGGAKKEGIFVSFYNNKIQKHLSGVGVSNGIAFDTNLNKLYYVDSFNSSLSLDQFDFDISNGTISNKTSIYTLIKNSTSKEMEVLDGMTIDTDGNLWVAAFNQSKILKIDPRKPGTVVESITFPTKQVTSLAFGGANLDELYVTSGRISVGGCVPTSPDYDGFLYKVTGINARGLPGVRIVI